MRLNVINNKKILKDAFDIQLNNFTVLTGENGSGKTQLLEFIRDFANGFDRHDEYGNSRGIFNNDSTEPMYPISDERGNSLTDIIYSYPGLRNSINEYVDHDLSLIVNIKQQWNQLEPIVIAYHRIRGKTFLNEEAELNEVNQALNRVVAMSTQPINGYTHPTTKIFQIYQLQELKKISLDSGKAVSDLTLLDYITFYQATLNIFSAAIDLLFHQFFLKQKYYPDLIRDVIPPWITFNEILEKASFKYKSEYIISTNDEVPLPVKLIDRSNGQIVDFQSLSSGETTVMALIFALYNSSNKGHFPQVILFDEPDAHLHPSLTQIFLDVVQNVLLKGHQVKVILTTHSPSTVALAPEESIYCMDRDLGHPIKIDKRAAINTLSFGLASVSIEESSLGISYNIKNANKDILFTEGITDKINLEIAWKKLYPGKAMNFFIQDCFSASFLGNLFTQGDQAPDGIFHQFKDLKMMALFDFDNAGYSQWNNEKKFPNILESDPKKGLTRHNSKNGYMILLPVPNIPEISGQVIISGNDTYKDKSHLTIESLFFNSKELKEFFKEESMPGGGKTNVFNNKSKRDFSDALSNLDANAFLELVPLFEKIQNIIIRGNA